MSAPSPNMDYPRYNFVAMAFSFDCIDFSKDFYYIIFNPFAAAFPEKSYPFTTLSYNLSKDYSADTYLFHEASSLAYALAMTSTALPGFMKADGAGFMVFIELLNGSMYLPA